MPPNPPTIRRFQPEDQAAVKALILAGLEEHWGTLDPARNPDLDDIATAYAGATFLVARRGDRIVGSGALRPVGDGVGEIVRMSVAADCRRQGLGGRILAALLDDARARDLTRITLETTATWQGAIAFYQAAGFRITHHQDGDVYFVLDL